MNVDSPELAAQKQLLLASVIQFTQNLLIFFTTVSEAHAKLAWQRIFRNSAAINVAIQKQVKGAIIFFNHLKNPVLVRVFASPAQDEAPTELSLVVQNVVNRRISLIVYRTTSECFGHFCMSRSMPGLFAAQKWCIRRW